VWKVGVCSETERWKVNFKYKKWLKYQEEITYKSLLAVIIVLLGIACLK
jgi:hypothetical protein